jgi:hypothetical protein
MTASWYADKKTMPDWHGPTLTEHLPRFSCFGPQAAIQLALERSSLRRFIC